MLQLEFSKFSLITCNVHLHCLVQLRRPAPPAARDHRPPPLPKPAKAAPCPLSSVTRSTRTASSESFASFVPRWRKTAATMWRHRLLRSISRKVQVEVGVFVYHLHCFQQHNIWQHPGAWDSMTNVYVKSSFLSSQISSMEIFTWQSNCSCRVW